jgi:alanine racemase
MHRAKSTRAAWLELDLGALKDNYGAIQHRVKPRTRVFAVLKTNAYGHGATN